jgi:hypothetical protein
MKRSYRASRPPANTMHGFVSSTSITLLSPLLPAPLYWPLCRDQTWASLLDQHADLTVSRAKGGEIDIALACMHWTRDNDACWDASHIHSPLVVRLFPARLKRVLP